MPQTETLAQKVRAKYPGVYDDLSDEDLDTKVRAKFPGVYDDIPKSSAPADLTEGRSVASRAIGGVLTGSGLAAIPGFIGTALTQNPLTTAKDLVKGTVAPLGRLANVGDAFRKAGITGAANEIAASIPILGPAAESASHRMKSGDMAGGIGEVVGMVGSVVAPSMVKPAMGVAGRVAPKVAAGLERGAAAKIADVIAPKVGANKQRFGNMAADVAPKLASEPGMGAFSRQGLADKVKGKLSESEAALDAANDARNPADLIETDLVTSGLEGKLRKLMAQPAEGEAAHAKARAWEGPKIPAKPPVSQTFKELPPEYQAEIRRLAAEMEEFPFIDRTWLDKSTEYAREGGYGSGRGARARQNAMPAEKPFVEGEGGTPIYSEVGGKGTSRNGMIRAMRQYIDSGDKVPSTLVQRVVNVADKRIRTPDSVSKPKLPLEAFIELPNGPVGESVIPLPNRPQAESIIQALKEVRALGPVATYDSLRTIRQAWDKSAQARYNPSMTADFLKVSGESKGAADVTGTLREVLSYADPETAAANKQYAFWRKAHDVLEATEEIERVRPTVGRKIAARFAGGVLGEAAGGPWGAAAGVLLGPVVDAAVTAGPTFKITLARGMDDLAKALKSGDVERSTAYIKRLRAIAASAKTTSEGRK